MAQDIGYLDDEEEVSSRKISPPSPIFLEPPMHAEDLRDRDIRLRQQLLIDEERKLAAVTAKEYKKKQRLPQGHRDHLQPRLRDDPQRTIQSSRERSSSHHQQRDQVSQDPRKAPGQVGTQLSKRCRRTPLQANQPPGRRPQMGHLSHRPR